MSLELSPDYEIVRWRAVSFDEGRDSLLAINRALQNPITQVIKNFAHFRVRAAIGVIENLGLIGFTTDISAIIQSYLEDIQRWQIMKNEIFERRPIHFSTFRATVRLHVTYNKGIPLNLCNFHCFCIVCGDYLAQRFEFYQNDIDEGILGYPLTPWQRIMTHGGCPGGCVGSPISWSGLGALSDKQIKYLEQAPFGLRYED